MRKKRKYLELRNYFLIHNWLLTDMAFEFYTERELCPINRSFGQPSVKATEDLLRRAKGADMDRETRGAVRKRGVGCFIFKTHAPMPRRLKQTVGKSDLLVNHIVQAHTMFIHSGPVLYMVTPPPTSVTRRYSGRSQATTYGKSTIALYAHLSRAARFLSG